MKTTLAPLSANLSESIRLQKSLALSLLDWHGGQSSALYAVGSCMLSDAEYATEYRPERHRGHADTETESGALSRAILELRNLRKNANHPECVTAKDEAECRDLADKLAAHFLPVY